MHIYILVLYRYFQYTPSFLLHVWSLHTSFRNKDTPINFIDPMTARLRAPLGDRVKILFQGITFNILCEFNLMRHVINKNKLYYSR